MTAFYTCIFSLDSSMGPYAHSKCYCMFVKQVRVTVPEEKQGAWYIQEFYAVKLPQKICWLFSKMIKYYFFYTVPLLLAVSNVKASILGSMRITDIFKTLVLTSKCSHRNKEENDDYDSEWVLKVKVKSLSRVRLFVTPWTVAHQAPPSMGSPRQEYWSGLPFPSPNED